MKEYIPTVRKNGESVLMAIRGALRGESFTPSAA